MTRFPDVRDLLPHRGRMCLVERIVEAREDGLVCSARIPRGSPLASGDTAPGLVAMEIGAQAAAVHEGLSRRNHGGSSSPAPGYLVRARDVLLAPERLPVDRPMAIDVRRVGGAAPLALYERRLALGGVELARGTIATYRNARS